MISKILNFILGNPLGTYFLGLFLGVVSCWFVFVPRLEDKIKIIRQEAFERGFMIKEIDKDDKVIYKLKEYK
jgi:hypothetical protein